MFVIFDYNVKLFILSFVVLFLASFASIDIYTRFKRGHKNVISYIFASGVVLGTGIWTLHFLGMLAYTHHRILTFEILPTLLSFTIATVAASILFFAISKNDGILRVNYITTFVVASGITGLHYIGMASMLIEKTMTYELAFIFLTLLICNVVIYSFGYFFKRFESNPFQLKHRLILSAIFSLGIGFMHYIAMIGTKMDTSNLTSMLIMDTNKGILSRDEIGYMIGISTILLFTIVILLAQEGRDRAEKMQESLGVHFQALIDNNPFPIFLLNEHAKIIKVNPKAESSFRFNDEELIDSLFLSLFSKENQPIIEEHIQTGLQGKTSEVQVSLLDGKQSTLHYSLTFVPIILSNKFSGLYVIASDLTALSISTQEKEKAQKDLVETIKKQQGMTVKFIKKEGKFIHTMADGELLYKMGFTSEMVVNSSLKEVVPEEIYTMKEQAYEEAWNGNATGYYGEVNGIHYTVRLSPIMEDGKVVEVIGSGVEITEAVMAKKKLEEERNLYKNILRTMSEAIIIYEEDGNQVDLNDNAYKFVGLTDEQIKNIKEYEGLYSFIKEDGTLYEQHEFPITHTFKTGDPTFDNVIGIKRDKNITWTSVNTVLLNNENEQEKKRVLVTASNITTQKNQELKLKEAYSLNRTVLNNLPIGIMMVDDQRDIFFSNSYFCSMFSLINETPTSLFGKSAIHYHPVLFKEQEKAEERIKNILRDKQIIVEELETKEGLMIKRTYIPFYMENNFKGHLWMFEDITDRKKMEQKASEAKEEAIKASIAKSEFLSKMSHELRTPLNGVLGFSQLLELDDSLTMQQKDFVQEILKGGRHLLNLINEVLDLSRIESGKLQFSEEPVDIVSVTKDCMKMVEPIAVKKNIHMQYVIHTKETNALKVIVYTDQLRLRQVILNLLDNAIKYNNANGKVQIVILLEENHVEFKVLDNGYGIKEEEQEKIFEPFYRIKEYNVEGTGIGLSLVKQLVTMMNGTYGVISKYGQGSEFYFTIPYGQNTRNYSSPFEKININLLDTEQQYEVLYIEDNEANKQLVEHIFSNLNGIKLTTTMTGKDGLHLANKSVYDLVLVDLNLPDISGIEIIQELKKEERYINVPLIVVSADALTEQMNRVKELGVEVYVTKPINIAHFTKVIYTSLKNTKTTP
ncbi:ATP-binding protein [Bacillus sp. FJAT-45066]|uniref:ATP-binding protein n=1 Tax=Bacillus sp. FJAT-45066 TaxID=2011010 RepID=UPI000BB917C8|nr:ATP-binding protein [Bacillus sp. FJAT-45066]